MAPRPRRDLAQEITDKIVLSPKEGLGYSKVSRLLTRNFEIVREAKVMSTIFPKGT